MPILTKRGRKKRIAGQIISIAFAFVFAFLAAQTVDNAAYTYASGDSGASPERTPAISLTEPPALRQELGVPATTAAPATATPVPTPRASFSPKPTLKPTPKPTAAPKKSIPKNPVSSRKTIGGYVIGKEYSFVTTGYCHCKKCNGKYAFGPLANGDMPEQGRTVAMGGVPLETRVRINGKTYVVEDRGVSGNHIDIFYESHSDALDHGKRKATVVVLAN